MGFQALHLMLNPLCALSSYEYVYNVWSELATHSPVAFQKPPSSVVDTTAGGGYATVGSGADSVDDCGLRFLMALKQFEYMLRCLPLYQKQQLKAKGLPTAHIIWALHSETEMELLNSIPAMQSTPSWENLRSVGGGWWLKNATTLRLCIEKIAKAAFQKRQDPMDAALYYLAMRKKNVLWGLFRYVLVGFHPATSQIFFWVFF